MKKGNFLSYCLKAAGLFYLLFTLSCRKLITVDSPKTQLTIDKVFTDDNSAVAMVSNIYTWFENSTLEGNLMPYISLYADEINPTTTNEHDMMYYNNAVRTDDYSNANVWKYLYFIIYESNSIISNLPGSPEVNVRVKKQLIGEVKFLRAFAYYFLINLYGDVPLVLSTNVEITSVLPRTSTVEIYDQIIRDLKEAVAALTKDYPMAEKTRANKWCAVALLSRVYLAVQDWANAEIQSSSIINSGQYALDSLKKVFLSNSDEAILQCWQQNGYTKTGSSYLPSSAGEIPQYTISSSLLSAFEHGDNRKSDWLKYVTISGKTYYYPFKYKIRTTSAGNNSEYTMMLRLGEQYLIRAEARVHQSNLSGAIHDLNIIRSRAGLKDLPMNLSPMEVLSAVEHERRVELFTEWGHRFFDLKRTGRIDVVLGAVKSSWNTSDQLYPIPQKELENNPYLKQNTGY